MRRGYHFRHRSSYAHTHAQQPRASASPGFEARGHSCPTAPAATPLALLTFVACRPGKSHTRRLVILSLVCWAERVEARGQRFAPPFVLLPAGFLRVAPKPCWRPESRTPLPAAEETPGLLPIPPPCVLHSG